jgi:3-deoxy-D-manno-octulosonic-acid transferase
MLLKQNVGSVIVAGSTVEGEEELVIGAFAEIREKTPRAALVLAPRHKERFDAVRAMLGKSGVQWSARSALNDSASLAGSVLLLDSLGELASVYALADVAFVGGSLVTRGGHNILEPAHWGVATIVGPHTENFRDIVGIFRQADAVRVGQPDGLATLILELLVDDDERHALGERARQVTEQQMGATQRTLEALRRLVEQSA